MREIRNLKGWGRMVMIDLTLPAFSRQAFPLLRGEGVSITQIFLSPLLLGEGQGVRSVW